MHDLDPAVLYALLRLKGKAKALKLKKKMSMKHLSWLLLVLSCVTKLIAYICNVKIVMC